MHWFVSDTAYSLFAGYWENVVLNLAFMCLFVIPLLGICSHPWSDAWTFFAADWTAAELKRYLDLRETVPTMGYFSTRRRILETSRSRVAFLLLGIAAFGVTEFGRYIYRPHVRQNNLNDFGLADSIGNLGGICVQIFLGLAFFNATRVQSYRLAVFFAVGYIVYEFVQPYLPKGVFDWKDIYGTVIGFVLSFLLISVVWHVVGSSNDRKNGNEDVDGTIT